MDEEALTQITLTDEGGDTAFFYDFNPEDNTLLLTVCGPEQTETEALTLVEIKLSDLRAVVAFFSELSVEH